MALIVKIRLRPSFVGQVRVCNKVMDEEVADLLNKITTENNTADDAAQLAQEQLIAS